MAQEALNNIRKHAQAQHAALSLKVERERVTLLVKDDGVGLLRQREQARRRGDVLIPGGWVVLRGHYGLVGIQERAALLGGTLRVQSAPGEGTTLRVELPR
jgi:signal transduction histidine kinase